MTKKTLTNKLVNDIMNILKDMLLVTIEEENDKLPIFNRVLNVIYCMEKHVYSYSLKDIDDSLFEVLMEEVINIFN